jgi:cell division protein FtsW
MAALQNHHAILDSGRRRGDYRHHHCTAVKKSADAPFLLVFAILLVSGLLIFISAALGLLARSGDVTFSSVAVSQLLFGFVGGGIALLFFAHIDYRLWRPYTPYFFGIAFFLTLLTFVPHIGLSLKGASRWIALGRFSFQPEELLKLASVLFLAAVYAKKYKTITTLKNGLGPLILIAGSASAILIFQPDTAGVVMMVLTSCGMFFAAGGRVSHIMLLACIGALAIGGAIIERPYLASRIETFINQSSDPQGAGWQIQQSLIAVGSGQLTGRGFGQSIQKFSYLPEPIGDSVFAVAAEEFGFIGTVLLVLLYASFGMLGLRIAVRASDPFGGLLVVGLVILIVGQSFFNIASTLGLVPLVGVPLIFVSQGGTALALALAEVGIILSVSKHMRHSKTQS